MKVGIKETKVGDVFSEESHYVVNKVAKDEVEFLHLESGKKVSLSNEYVTNLLNTSDQYDNEVKVSKKGVAEKAKQLITELIREPILPYEKGEDRILRGYKMQFVSRDGKYRCRDMDITRTDKETGERLANINTVSQLIYNGTKYIVD